MSSHNHNHNTKGDISVHKKTSQSENNNYINKLLLRESGIPTIRAESRSIKTKETRHTDKKEPRSLLKALLFILLSLLSLLLLLKIGKRGAHSYSHHRERIQIREHDEREASRIKEREEEVKNLLSIYIQSLFPGKRRDESKKENNKKEKTNRLLRKVIEERERERFTSK